MDNIFEDKMIKQELEKLKDYMYREIQLLKKKMQHTNMCNKHHRVLKKQYREIKCRRYKRNNG